MFTKINKYIRKNTWAYALLVFTVVLSHSGSGTHDKCVESIELFFKKCNVAISLKIVITVE